MKGKTKSVRFFGDPGHGWSRVKRAELVELRIITQISSFSYEKGQWVYLEEDSDTAKYLAAIKAKGFELVWKATYANNESKIRSYAPFCLRGEELDAGPPPPRTLGEALGLY